MLDRSSKDSFELLGAVTGLVFSGMGVLMLFAGDRVVGLFAAAGWSVLLAAAVRRFKKAK